MAQNGVAAETRQDLAENGNAFAEAKQEPANSGNAAAEAKQVLAASGKGGYVLDPDNLEAILLADGVMDKPVVVISVAGAFRKGKSFLLDMMLRYLTARNKSNWIHEQSTKGFPWRSGFRRHTTGILMWSQPIPVTLPDGTEAVILLMDTQGTFDSQSTAQESSTVFALSTLLSSLQIFNLTGNLQNDDLEHLQLFTEYGRMALDDKNGTTPFQKLLFLVRDWQFVDDLPLGAEGGDGLVKEWLDTKTGKSELENVRKHIRDCFSEIKGFLLPPPGQRVASNNFSGNSADMDPAFVTKLEELMPKLLAPENLTVKTIAGNPVTAGELYTFFGVYADLFSRGDLPKPKNIMQATADANNMAAAQEAKIQYIKEMECLLRDDEPPLESNALFRKHVEALDKAKKAFSDRKKMGDWKTSEEYGNRLLKDIDDWFNFAEQANNTKREKELLNVDSHNLNVVGTCKMAYRSHMDLFAGEDATFVPQKEMSSEHEKAKRKATDQFEAERKVFAGNAKDYRSKLNDEIDIEFRQMLVHNDLKKDAKNFKAAQANNNAVKEAVRKYQDEMSRVTSSDVPLPPEKWDQAHRKALKAAEDMFESLMEGGQSITKTYLEAMRNDIDRENESNKRNYDNRLSISNLQRQLAAMEREVEKAKKPSKQEHTINDLQRKLAAMEQELEKAKKTPNQERTINDLQRQRAAMERELEKAKNTPKQEEKSSCIVM